MIEKKLKRCGKCKLEKPFSQYNKHVNSYDGVQGYCRDCEKIRQRGRHAQEREERNKIRLSQRVSLDGEIWKPVVGYEGRYEVSNLGRVYCVIYGTIMFQSNLTDGGKSVKLRFHNRKAKSWKVHRLVAIAFIDNPENKDTVDHKNNNRSNNTVDNLQWATRSEQIKWAYERGRDRKYGERSNTAKLTDAQAAEIRLLYKNGHRYSELRRKYNLTDSNLCSLLAYQTYKTA